VDESPDSNFLKISLKEESIISRAVAVDIVYLDFSEAFGTVSHNILTGKLCVYGLDAQTVRWVKKRLRGRA